MVQSSARKSKRLRCARKKERMRRRLRSVAGAFASLRAVVLRCRHAVALEENDVTMSDTPKDESFFPAEPYPRLFDAYDRSRCRRAFTRPL